MIMYYVEIVPTDIETFASHIKTYQYSVKENTRIIGELGVYVQEFFEFRKIYKVIERFDVLENELNFFFV